MAAIAKALEGYRETPEGTEKRCSKCREWWPADLEFFHANPNGGHLGLNYQCKACYEEWRRSKCPRTVAETGIPAEAADQLCPPELRLFAFVARSDSAPA